MPAKSHSDLKLAGSQKTTIPSVPFRTPMFGTDGTMTRTWVLFFEQLGAAFSAILAGGVGPGAWGGVALKTESYAAHAADDGLLIVFAAAGAVNFSLPATAPSNTWKVFVQNIGAAAVTLVPSGPQLDGVVATATLAVGQGVYISTDGTNYFTERGLVPTFGTNGTANGSQALLNLVAGTNVTLTDDGSGDVTIATTGGGGGGGAVVKTASYTATGADSGKLLVFNAVYAVTLTLPAASPGATWDISAQNIGVGELTVSRNSLDIDGVAADLLLCQSQGVYISTDGTNYFTERGGPLAGSTISSAAGAAVLTLAQTATGSGGGLSVLNVTNASQTHDVIHAIASDSGHTGIAVFGKSPAGYGCYGEILDGSLGGAGVVASGADGNGLFAVNNHGVRPTVVIDAIGLGPSCQFNTFLYSVGASLAAINAYPYTPFAGSFLFCTDAKNIVDDGAAAGSVAVGGGHGAMLARINGSWRVMC